MRLSRISTVLFALGLGLAACSKEATPPAAEAPKSEPAAPAAEAPKADPAAEAPKADAAPAAEAPKVADTADLVAKSAEEAFTLYTEGTKNQDGEKLWAVMPKMQQVMMEQVKGQALSAPAEQLDMMGIKADEIRNLSAKQFFVYMVKKAPVPGAIPVPTDVKVEAGAEANLASATFKLDSQNCKAQLGSEEGAWKVIDLQCDMPPSAVEHAPIEEAPAADAPTEAK